MNLLLWSVLGSPLILWAQTGNKPAKDAAIVTGKYRNLFKEAGYRQKDIDAKVAKAYSDLFENPNGIYFEVEDSLAYVSDVKNRDARTEGLSYGMMVAVQLNKRKFLTASGVGQKVFPAPGRAP
ncbi:hypothetical protein LWM68_12175 [Niabella sp. W65]|nr:hypothetical protein [Niabella sp. W65]MCH7363435.1 hypothetical protein [Niabella sp. W65]